MQGSLEEWTEVVNLWPFVEREVSSSLLSEHKKLALPDETSDIAEVRYRQGIIEGMQRVLAVPRRVMERLEKMKEKETGDDRRARK